MNCSLLSSDTEVMSAFSSLRCRFGKWGVLTSHNFRKRVPTFACQPCDYVKRNRISSHSPGSWYGRLQCSFSPPTAHGTMPLFFTCCYCSYNFNDKHFLAEEGTVGKFWVACLLTSWLLPIIWRAGLKQGNGLEGGKFKSESFLENICAFLYTFSLSFALGLDQ